MKQLIYKLLGYLLSIWKEKNFEFLISPINKNKNHIMKIKAMKAKRMQETHPLNYSFDSFSQQ